MVGAMKNPFDHPQWPTGHHCITFETIDSTMDEAARQGATLDAPTWFIAKHQTKARGRRGKVWKTPQGNLNATLAFTPLCTPQVAALRSFVAANALYEALSMYISPSALSLKWPNDVLLHGGKVAGILLETSGNGPFVKWLSIGFGVNLAFAPEGVDNAFPPVSLAGEGGERVSPEDFLVTLADAFATQESKLDRLGFDRIRTDWLKNAAKLGETITAIQGAEVIQGTFDTVDKDGNLVLITAKGPRSITAADVYFGER